MSDYTCGISFAIPVPSFFGKLNSMCDACLKKIKLGWSHTFETFRGVPMMGSLICYEFYGLSLTRYFLGKEERGKVSQKIHSQRPNNPFYGCNNRQ